MEKRTVIGKIKDSFVKYEKSVRVTTFQFSAEADNWLNQMISMILQQARAQFLIGISVMKNVWGKHSSFLKDWNNFYNIFLNVWN